MEKRNKKYIDRIDFLGIPIDRLDLPQICDAIEERIAGGGTNRIVVVNAAKVVKALKNPALRELIGTADLVSPDGMGVVYASRLLGGPLPGRVNGTDLMELLLERSGARGYRVFFLGSDQAVVERVADLAMRKYPGIVVAGFCSYFETRDQSSVGKEREASIVEKIRQTGADILLVALPTPLKEYFIAENLQALNVAICHGVGGSFDMMAGIVKRAPRWSRQVGLEWAYRWWQEPIRMARRNLIDSPRFVALVLKEFVRRRLGFFSKGKHRFHS